MSYRGNRIRGGASRQPQKSSQACRFFRAGKCTFGPRCRFSHDKSSSSAPSGHSGARPPRNREPDDERVSKFKRLVASGTYGTSSSEQNLFALGVDVLTNVQGADAQQQIITLLASEGGLSCIRQVVESRIPRAMMVGTTFAKRRIWETDICPLFRLVTFESVIFSNILEEKVATIYNFIAGVGGARLPAWFDLAQGLAEAPDLPVTISSIEVAELCLAVLSKMMGCSSSHISNPKFREYANSFIRIATTFDDITAANKMSKIQAMEYASVISCRLDFGSFGGGLEDLHPSLASLSLNQDFPGSLSGNGRRHDNDHDDITNISILPTRDEIASDRNEYLPTVDPALWHRQGIAGRLDREFRLLREDTAGQLRNVVRTELKKMQQGACGPNSGPRETLQYCTYQNTSIVELGFDRRTGPEFVFRFRQPARGSGTAFPPGDKDMPAKEEKSLALRRDWWARAKKRLQPGGLVCAVDSRGLSHFLIVADSTQRFSGDLSQRQSRPSAGAQKDENNAADDGFTLADDSLWSFVKLRLPPGGDTDQLREILTQLFFKTKTKSYARTGAWVHEHEPSCILIEFPGILLDSFLHTLRALQAATSALNVPFASLLASSESGLYDLTDDGMASIPPPKYAQKPNFAFDMSCLSRAGARGTSFLSHSIDAPISAKEIEEQTRLDMTQSAAVIDALSRSVALVQGPPGTGKTYAGVEILKVLLHNRKKADLGPILIVCYTNHALDQLLEHVLDARASTQIIRMGSRSKSVRLQELNLYKFSQGEGRTRSERSSMYEYGQELDVSTREFKELSSTLGRAMSFKSMAKFLEQHRYDYFMQLFPSGSVGSATVDSEGFTTVQEHQNKTMLKWMRGNDDIEAGQATQATAENQETVSEIRERLQSLLEKSTTLDIFALNTSERAVLYQMWQYESFSRTAAKISRQHERTALTKQSYDHVRQETDLRCLQRAEIVGVTTTGLARNLDLLKNLRSKVLLCEEAGEVLEAHMLSSLIPSLEHLILIGDHQQLRPQVQNYDLRSDSAKGAQYSFDMSLFERLVSPLDENEIRLPFSQLSTQRRMHPSISDLIRAPLYPSLQDGANVMEYPEIPGLERCLFWLQHDQLEKGETGGRQQADPTSTSRTNLFEVDMTAALVSHLFKQGTYGPGDIAVLTPYLGQMMLLQRRLSSMFEVSFNERDEVDLETAAAVGAGAMADVAEVPTGSKVPVTKRATLSNSVRIATVDNFQGEEAKVIVVSMVRSNKQQRCGFLSTSNRINVLLSRAKHGMYIIGNSDTCSRVPMWQQVIGNLEAGGNIGPTLRLRCPRHAERRFEVSMPEHFVQFAPDGGCLEPCNKPLPCGHICSRPCHADAIHAAVACMEPCTRPQKGCEHACPRQCSSPCPLRCAVVMTDVKIHMACGHVFQRPKCWQVQKPESIKCPVEVSCTFSGCSHVVTAVCSDMPDTCPETCGVLLGCGHTCWRTCFECNTSVVSSALKHRLCLACEHATQVVRREATYRALLTRIVSGKIYG